jgi:hypothetical protein
MSTRKPKSPLLTAFDMPEKRLQLITVSVKRDKAPVLPRIADSDGAALFELPPPAKRRLH